MRRVTAVLFATVALCGAACAGAQAVVPGANGKVAFSKPGLGSYPDIWTVEPDGTGALNLTQTYGRWDFSPSWSPDRTKIAFESFNGDYTGIYVMNANGSERRPVDGTGDCRDLAWSPDGTKFAMSCERINRPAIYVANIDGSGFTRITDDDYFGPADTAPAWSPDGAQIAWSLGGDLWKMNADGANKTLLVDNPLDAEISDVTWSPDGREVAFAGDRDCVGCSKSDIYRVFSNGTGLTRFGYTPDTVNGLTYSPDGTKILFDSCERRDATANCYDLALYTMNSDGTDIQPFPGTADDLGGEPDWATAGPPFLDVPPAPGQIVFASHRDHLDLPDNQYWDYAEIYTMNPDGSRQRRLTANAYEDNDPSWSVDGTRIAFSSRRDGNFEIYAMNAGGGDQTRLTDDAAQDRDPTWSADGSRLAFTRLDSSSGRWRLMVMNADGGNVQPVFGSPPSASDLSPDWSPTANRIVFSRNSDIYSVNPDGTELVALTDDVGVSYQDSLPNWAPGGGVLAFTRYRSSGDPAQIWIMQGNGTFETQYWVSSHAAYAPSWDPEGRRIAFNGDDGQIYINGPNGRIPLTAHPNGGGNPDWQPVFGYPRPKGATPARFSLVTANERCTAPNREHGPPLAFGSCTPPDPASAHLTVGTADANGMPARNEGYVLFRTVVGAPSTPTDEADVRLEMFMDDVFTQSLADYAGELRAMFNVRITDKSSPGPGSGTAGTVTDIPLAAVFGCTPAADPQEGSSCSGTTTVDALIPGAVSESKRSIWQLDQVRVFDGGADGEADTTGDNTLFATAGLFVP